MALEMWKAGPKPQLQGRNVTQGETEDGVGSVLPVGCEPEMGIQRLGLHRFHKVHTIFPEMFTRPNVERWRKIAVGCGCVASCAVGRTMNRG